MLTRRSHNTDGEERVIISLAISLGMIILAVLGLWLWKVLAPIALVLSGLSPIEMP
jgi:hypothetical protein